MIFGITLLVLSMVLYFAAMGWGLPHYLLKPDYLPVPLTARGLRRCMFKGKRCVVYERSKGQRDYITRFLLCEGEKCKLLKCKVTPSVRKLVYDVILFDRYDRIFDIVHVKETVSSPYTKLLCLPKRTSYVEIELRKVNKTKLAKKRRIAEVPARKIALYIISAITLTFVESAAVTTGIAFTFGGVFREDLARNLDWRLLVVAVVTALVGMSTVLIALGRRRKA